MQPVWKAVNRDNLARWDSVLCSWLWIVIDEQFLDGEWIVGFAAYQQFHGIPKLHICFWRYVSYAGKQMVMNTAGTRRKTY